MVISLRPRPHVTVSLTSLEVSPLEASTIEPDPEELDVARNQSSEQNLEEDDLEGLVPFWDLSDLQYLNAETSADSQETRLLHLSGSEPLAEFDSELSQPLFELEAEDIDAWDTKA